jgi:CheY-like chemotaxis protein
MAALDLVTQEPNLTEEAVEALEMIRENVQTEARLIGDLLDLTRIQQAKFELKREIVDAHSILRFVMNFFSREIETKQLKIGLQLDARDSTLFADAGRLQQVFWNLLSNAVKFTPESGSITVSTSSDSEKLKIQVADTGIGITPETMSRLFNAFEQGEQTLSRRYGGLGLGLSISKTLVEIQGGTIKASSEGKGAVFTVELPLAAAQGRPAPLPLPISPKARTQPIRLQPDHKEITKAENGGYDILLVEDNRDTLHTLSRLLQRAGYRVSCATTAREAIQLEKSKRHDLLLSDIGLPDASGWEMLLELRKISPRIAAVAMSGYGAPEDTEKSRQAGFYEHLVKPVNYQNLRAVLERAPICSGAWLDS